MTTHTTCPMCKGEGRIPGGGGHRRGSSTCPHCWGEGITQTNETHNHPNNDNNQLADHNWLQWMGFTSIDYHTDKIQRHKSPTGADGSTLIYRMRYQDQQPYGEPYHYTSYLYQNQHQPTQWLPIRTKTDIRNWFKLNGITIRDDHNFEHGTWWNAAIKTTGKRTTTQARPHPLQPTQLQFEAQEYQDGQKTYQLNELHDFHKTNNPTATQALHTLYPTLNPNQMNHHHNP